MSAVTGLEIRARALHASTAALTIGGAVEAEIPPPNVDEGFLPPALWWVEAGYTVFPLYPADELPEDDEDVPAKKPNYRVLGDGNTQDTIGSNDPDQVRRWWRWEPASNIAIATRQSGVLVVDIDPRNRGWERFLRICEAYSIDLADVPRSQSASQDGGVHLYWRIPDGVKCLAAALVTGVDRPWQVPVPPSSRLVKVGEDRSGTPLFDWRNYEWLSGDPRDLPMAPDVLLGPQLRDETSGGSGGSGGKNGESSDGSFSYTGTADDVLPQTEYGSIDHDRLDKVLIPDGQQSYHLKRIAASLARRHSTETEIADRLMDIAADLPQDPNKRPWARRDIEPMARHAYKWVKDQRRREQEAAEALREQGISKLERLRRIAGIS